MKDQKYISVSQLSQKDQYNEEVSQKKRHNSLENQYFLKIQPPTEPRDYSPNT
jgi:hypothetical protein